MNKNRIIKTTFRSFCSKLNHFRLDAQNERLLNELSVQTITLSHVQGVANFVKKYIGGRETKNREKEKDNNDPDDELKKGKV